MFKNEHFKNINQNGTRKSLDCIAHFSKNHVLKSQESKLVIKIDRKQAKYTS